MTAANPSRIVKDIIEVHGGMDYWKSLAWLDAEISASGFLFTAVRDMGHSINSRRRLNGVFYLYFSDISRFQVQFWLN